MFTFQKSFARSSASASRFSCRGRRLATLMFVVAGVISGSFALVRLQADESDAKDAKKPKVERTPEAAEIQQALTEFNSLIGEWRGVGMPKRNSNSGAWKESANWVWDFDAKPLGIRYDVKDGKLIEQGLLSFDPKQKQFTLAVLSPDETKRTYVGKLDEKKLVLETTTGDEEEGHRLTITRLNEKRTLVLHEKRRAGQTFFSRVAEVGYTREGTRLADPGAGEPECLVTGGYGSMKVMFEGETYYVCCTGCLQAFQEDPAGVVAEYKQKLTDRKKEAGK